MRISWRQGKSGHGWKKSKVQQVGKHCGELGGFPAHGKAQRGERRGEEENK